MKRISRHFLELFLWLVFVFGFLGFGLDILNAIVGFPYKGVWTHEIFLTPFFIFSVVALLPISFIGAFYDRRT